jgi:hypothetical protein
MSGCAFPDSLRLSLDVEFQEQVLPNEGCVLQCQESEIYQSKIEQGLKKRSCSTLCSVFGAAVCSLSKTVHGCNVKSCAVQAHQIVHR